MEERDWYQISLKLIIKNKENKILGLKSLGGGMFRGKFDLPGGRINADEIHEPFTSIVAREVLEELGSFRYDIDPSPVAISKAEFPDYPGMNGKTFRVLYIFFGADYVSGDFKISDEHSGFEWLDLSAINIMEKFAPPEMALTTGQAQYL